MWNIYFSERERLQFLFLQLIWIALTFTKINFPIQNGIDFDLLAMLWNVFYWKYSSINNSKKNFCQLALIHFMLFYVSKHPQRKLLQIDGGKKYYSKMNIYTFVWEKNLLLKNKINKSSSKNRLCLPKLQWKDQYRHWHHRCSRVLNQMMLKILLLLSKHFHIKFCVWNWVDYSIYPLVASIIFS